MSVVGKVMKSVNRKGDPVAIKKLLEKSIGSSTPITTTTNDE